MGPEHYKNWLTITVYTNINNNSHSQIFSEVNESGAKVTSTKWSRI